MTQAGTLKIAIPDGWTAENVIGVYLKSDGAAAQTGYIREGCLYINTSLGAYAIREKYNSNTTALALEDGVYKIKWCIELVNSSGDASMANDSFDDDATIVVKDGIVRLELVQHGVALGGEQNYLSRMWIDLDNGEDYAQAVATAYRKDESGALYTMRMAAGRQVC